MNTSPSTPERPQPEPNAAQKRVLERIAVQRERLRARRARQALHRAALQAEQGLGADAPLLLRAAVFAKQHPAAVAAMAGVALVAGPKRLMRWVGVALPLLMRLRSQR